MVMDTIISPHHAVGSPLTEAALCAWLGAAAPGDRISYHRGFLARQTCKQLACLPEPERIALLGVASRAWKLAEAGLADLVQQRHDFEDYSYILVARRRPRRAAPAVLPILLAEAA